MNIHLNNYDIYPRIVKENSRASITIKPLGRHAQEAFEGKRLTICVLPLTESDKLMTVPGSSINTIEANESGCLVFDLSFGSEQEYLIRIYDENVDYENKALCFLQLSIYALADDLFALRPYKGDLHLHSNRSDGKEAPAIVAAHYRKAGFDFMAITDHRNYYGSIEAINAYKDVPIDLTIIPGEEIHTPDNNVHIVSFGGEESITDMFTNNSEDYYNRIYEIMKTIDVPEEINKFAFASCIWAYKKIKEVNGLGIFVHPHWMENVNNVPDKFTEELFRHKIFEVFELISGISGVHTNERQIAFYNDMKSLGFDYPIVASSDSHGTLNYHAGISFNKAYTIVFAKSCAKEDLFRAIRNKYTTAVDNSDDNIRIYGSYRLVAYSRFLIENYFEIHDEMCFEEGIQMKRYACGDSDSVKHLELLQGRTKRFLEHCFKHNPC